MNDETFTGGSSEAGTNMDETSRSESDVKRDPDNDDSGKQEIKGFTYRIVSRATSQSEADQEQPVSATAADSDTRIDPFSLRPMPPKTRTGPTGNLFDHLTITTMRTVRTAGATMVTSLVTTIPAKSTLFSSCIFGCDTVTFDRTLVTVLPLRLPCSLISCPPCPTCVPSTVRISLCPFISTVTPGAKVALVNGPQITIVRSTVTRTACTATKILSLRPSSQTKSTTVLLSTTPAVKDRPVEQATAVARQVSEEKAAPPDDADLALPQHDDGRGAYIIEDDIERIPRRDFEDNIERIPRRDFDDDIERIPRREKLHKSKQKDDDLALTVTRTVTTGTGIVTVTTTIIPIDSHLKNQGGVCSTFVICNPTQFTCPAQITNMPQIATIVQSILAGQEKFGSGGVGTRQRSPNGAFIDEVAPAEGVLGDGSQFNGGFAGFGPGGIFEKVIGGAANRTASSEPSVSYSTITVTLTESVDPQATVAAVHRYQRNGSPLTKPISAKVLLFLFAIFLLV